MSFRNSFYENFENNSRRNRQDTRFESPRWQTANVKATMVQINDFDKFGAPLWKAQSSLEVVFYKDETTLTVEIPGFHREEILCSEIDRNVVAVGHYTNTRDLVDAILNYMIDTAQFPYPVFELC